VLDWVALKGRTIHALLDGQPIVVVENGKLMEENLRRAELSLTDLESLLRVQGYFDLSAIEVALLETNGQVSVRPKSQNRPVQPADLGLPTAYEALSTQVIHEGRPLVRELKGLGLSEEWVLGRLAEQGVTGPAEVSAAWLTSDGRLVVDRYADRPH
jgi:uncharacterized membrane protein YcaP (DUF421 family)